MIQPTMTARRKTIIERDQAIVARLDDYVPAQKPFVDPDLTLARLPESL